MLRVGSFSITRVSFGTFKLDGGAMFGSVPKPIWSRRMVPDEQNRIALDAGALLVQYQNRRILVDAGFGAKWSEKEQNIFGFESSTDPTQLEGITDVIITHLHFDHAGGLSSLSPSGELYPTFKSAKHYVHSENWKTAHNPNAKESASYLKSNYAPLNDVELTLIDETCELFPGLSVIPAFGHTKGLLWVKICDQGRTVVFPSDLIPTSHHVRLPYIMGYDMCAGTTLKEKAQFLAQASKEDWLIILQHDPNVFGIKVQELQRTASGPTQNIDYDILTIVDV
jgi:glyoxylase-like metal-dependent hydrolase (beta-lactamase superfamily II)